MATNPVGWFEIYVQDLNRAKAFYEGVFKTHLAPLVDAPVEIEMLVFPMEDGAYGAPGALVHMPGFTLGGHGQNSVLVYFSCEDCAVEASRAAEFGGSVFKEKWSIGNYGHIALILDTEGNMIGLHSMV